MPTAAAATLLMHRPGSDVIARPYNRRPAQCESADVRNRFHLRTGAQADESYATKGGIYFSQVGRATAFLRVGVPGSGLAMLVVGVRGAG
jgi:hypothetical protein